MSYSLYIFLLIVFLSGGAAHAERVESPEELKNRYRYRIENTLSEIAASRNQDTCEGCEMFRAGSSTKKYSPQCRQRYRDFYRIKDKVSSEGPQDQTIEIRMAFGYMDYITSVDDQYVAAAFATSLTRRCSLGQSACGFTPDPDDAELLTKEMRIMGPDGRPRRRLIKLHLRSASYTNDERLNRGTYLEEQKQKTAEAKHFFEEGLARADMVLYVGHARDGGGPDFGPPMVNPKTRRTDYNWHRANPHGLASMLKSLKEARSPAKFVGIFACNAKEHFGEYLRKTSPKTSFVLSGANEFEASVGQAAATLDSVLGMKCSPEFTKAVNTIKNIYDYPIAPVSVD